MAALLLVSMLLAALAVPAGAGAYRARRTCAEPPPGRAACMAMRVLLGRRGETRPRQGSRPALAVNRAGERTKPYPGFLTPEALHAAYELPVETGAAAGQTIALVDAYDDPTAEADLAVFDQQFSLPACTSQNGCFRKVNQSGAASPLPKVNGGWASEISIDVQMAHAICQSCKILLVEAESEDFADLGAAVDAAASLGADEVSNSYGGIEEPFDTQLAAADYDHPGIVLTASSGDCGYRNTWCIHNAFGANFPANSPAVVAVGGTSLTEAAGSWSSTAWAQGGSGCSEIFEAASWQSGIANFAATGCGSGRAVADVSAVGDPDTGVDVYDSTPESPGGPTGWGAWGGTSVSAPIVAAEFALAGGAGGVAYPAESLYAHFGEGASLYDVTSGSDGECEGATICEAAAGFDGPTGVGSPLGLGAFAPAGAPELTARPSLTGYPEVGDTLTEAHGGWSGEPSSYAYQWERCGASGAGCKPIAGASGQSFAVTAGDTGYTIRVRETASNASGASSAASAPTAAVSSGVPSIASLSPASALTGATIAVEGQALDQATSVAVGALPASFTVVSQTKLNVIVPNGAVKGRVTVTTPQGTATGKQKFVPSLSIASFSPAGGPAGTLVTIRGAGFNASSKVSFAGTPAEVTSVVAKKLRVRVPSGAAAGPISVTNVSAPAGTVVSAASFAP